MNSSTVAATDQALASQYNNLRKDVIVMAGDFATSGGSANTQTLSIDSQYTAYSAGDVVRFKAGYTNTSATTINVNSIGAKSIKKHSFVDLQPGDILKDSVYYLMYDGTSFQLLNASTPPSSIINNAYGNTIVYSDIYDLVVTSFSLNVTLKLCSGYGDLYKNGNSQSIIASTIWASADVFSGQLIREGYIYAFLVDTGVAARIYRCALSADISSAGNWTQLTISGTALNTSGGLIGYGDGKFWTTDGSANFVPYTLSGTTLTSATSVNVTGSNYNSQSRVCELGILAKFASNPEMQLADFSGTLDANRQWDLSTVNYVCCYPNSFYGNYYTGNTPIFYRLVI